MNPFRRARILEKLAFETPWGVRSQVSRSTDAARQNYAQGGTPTQKIINQWNADNPNWKPPTRPADPNQALMGSVTGGSQQFPQGVVPWLRDVYKNAPGGLDLAVNVARQYGSPVSMESLSRPVNLSSQEYDRRSGVTEFTPYLKNKSPIEVKVDGPDAKTRAEVLAHEFTHAGQGQAAPWGSGYDTRNIVNPVGGSSVPKAVASDPSISDWLQYARQRQEIGAEYLRKVRHWGAARGMSPTNEREANDLMNQYYQVNRPDQGGSVPPKGSEQYHTPGDWIKPFMWQDLRKTPGIGVELLRTVRAPGTSGKGVV